MILLELSKEDLGLSRAEAEAIAETTSEQFQNFIVFKENFAYDRLAYTKRAFEILVSCEEKDLKETIKEFNFNIRGSFAVYKAGESDFDVKDLADMVWRRLKNQIVDLKNPKNRIYFVFAEKAFCCKLLWENKEKFEERKSHNRPEPHPTSLDPRLARALVNLVDAEEILDPFCGSGGILIEAGLLGLKVRGSDLDQVMLNRALINLEHYKIKHYSLEKKDAADITEEAEAIVTDLPYGKNSKVDGLKITYLEFLENAEKLTKKMVVIFPSFVDHEKLIKKTHWKIKKEFEHYLHKSLSRKIILLYL